MTEADHLSWLASAVDALDGIRASEVATVSVQVRRKITRPAQIVPEIANLVAEKRAKASATTRSMTALEYAQGALERNLPQHYEAWMAEAKRRGEI